MKSKNQNTHRTIPILPSRCRMISNRHLRADGLGAFPGGPIVLSPHTALILAR